MTTWGFMDATKKVQPCEDIYKEWFSLECDHGLSDLRMLGDLKDDNYVPNVKDLVYQMIAEAT